MEINSTGIILLLYTWQKIFLLTNISELKFEIVYVYEIKVTSLSYVCVFYSFFLNTLKLVLVSICCKAVSPILKHTLLEREGL